MQWRSATLHICRHGCWCKKRKHGRGAGICVAVVCVTYSWRQLQAYGVLPSHSVAQTKLLSHPLQDVRQHWYKSGHCSMRMCLQNAWSTCAILQSLGLLAAIHLSKYASWSGTVSQSLIAFGTYHPSSFDKHPRDPGPNIMTLLCFWKIQIWVQLVCIVLLVFKSKVGGNPTWHHCEW